MQKTSDPWIVHHPLALKAGLAPAVAADLAQGKRPTGMKDDEEIVYQSIAQVQ